MESCTERQKRKGRGWGWGDGGLWKEEDASTLLCRGTHLRRKVLESLSDLRILTLEALAARCGCALVSHPGTAETLQLGPGHRLELGNLFVRRSLDHEAARCRGVQWDRRDRREG